ncbi:MAG: HAD family hydrolase [Lachnospiraceae bacterium]|jgi:phosphoglycolate phosphatase|nr:HAD family hydrolase [Lachnospiraceae bacterium]
MIKAVVFDMDGTILNTLEDLKDSVNAIMKQYDFPEHTLGEIRSYVGNGSHKLIERSVPAGTDADTIERVHDAYVPYYQAHCAIKTRPYDGIVELLQRLRAAGIKTAVVSNKGDGAVKDLCKLHFPGLFDAEVGAREGLAVKPARDLVDIALKELDVPRDEVVYVGDSEVDFQTAQNSELQCINVLWGFRDKDFLESKGAKVFAETAEELEQKILGGLL